MQNFKEGIKASTIKRADAMKIRLEDIHEEPGFNLRREGEDLEASIDALAAHIRAGGIYPALEVRPRADGGVWIVDGHRRRRALARIADDIRGPDGEVWVNIVPFAGNDADRTLRVITSAEGRALSPLEVAEGYKRLTAFGWKPDDIAKRVGKTRQHVDQMLILANADSDVQAQVEAGNVSASTAITTVRKHGSEAGTKIAEAVAVAKANGKTKATQSAVKGKGLPRKLTDEAAASVEAFVRSLPLATVDTLATLKLSDPAAAPMVEVSAFALVELQALAEAIADARAALNTEARQNSAQAAQVDIDDAIASFGE